MTEFIITAPDGKKYKVTGDSQEGAVAALKKMLGGGADAPPPAEAAPDARAERKARYEALRAKGLDPEVVKNQASIDATAEGVMRDGAVGAFAGNIANGMTLGFADNIAAWIGSMVEDRSYDEILSGLRRQRSTQEQIQPKSVMAGDIVGGVAGTGAGIALAAPKALAALPKTMAGKTIVGGGTGIALGATEGAISGAGYADGENLSDAAVRGAMTGAAFGGAAGSVAPALGAGIKNVLERLRGKDVKLIAKTLGVSDDAAKALRPDIEALDFTSAMAALRKAGPDAMLADAGRPVREALDAAITGGGKAARIGGDAVYGRAAQAGERLGKVMDVILGVPKGVKAVGKSISERTAPARAKAYKMAYSTPIDYADDVGRNIEGVLARVDPTTLKAAISEANDAMRAAGVKNAQIMAEISDAGEVTFREMPNVQQLDEIKKGLDSIARAETDDITGKITSRGRRAKLLAADLRTAIVDAVPAYKTAVKLGGDKIGEETALNMGRKIFGTGYTRETVAEVMSGASVEAKDAARQGIREYVDDTLARVRRSFDDPDADTTETLRLLNTLSSRDAREKLVMVLGQGKADRLLAEIDAAGKQFGTRQAIATGSATGRREARSRALDDILAPGMVGNAAKGQGVRTIRSFVQMVTRATPQADLERRQEVLAEVARALTELRGPQAEKALKLVEKAVSGQPLKTEEALQIARLASSTGALVGYQTAQKYISSRQSATQGR